MEGHQKKALVVRNAKITISKGLHQFLVTYFFLSRPRFELTVMKIAPSSPQTTPVASAQGIAPIVGTITLLTPNLSTDD